MKKFSNIEKNKNEKVNNIVNEESEIKSLIENLSIEIEDENKIWEKDFKINIDSKFYENFKKIIDKINNKEKIQLLEKAKMSIISRDVDWIENEIDNIKKASNDD